MNIKILVATHKKYWMPEDKRCIKQFFYNFISKHPFCIKPRIKNERHKYKRQPKKHIYRHYLICVIGHYHISQLQG